MKNKLIMKNLTKTLTLLVLALFIQEIHAQVLKDGHYVAENGIDHRNITVTPEGIIKASISTGTDYYKKISGNLYEGYKTVKLDGSLHKVNYRFFLEIKSKDEIVLYREGQQKYTLKLKTTEDIISEMDDCPVYKKYTEKANNDPANSIVWTTCATVALQLCNAPDDETRKALLEGSVILLKGVSPDKCPCSDVIPARYWE